MNRLKFHCLRFNKTTIKFNDCVNYIVGDNFSGKTTIFNLLQYVLGIKRDLDYLNLQFCRIELEASIAGIEYLFTRNIGDNRITVESNTISDEWNINSTEFSEFLFQIFKPHFRYEIDVKVVKALIRESFVSDINTNRYSRNDEKFHILGGNKWYEKKINKYLNDLSKEIKNKKQSLKEIESFKNDSLFIFSQSSGEAETAELKKVLENVYLKYQNNFNEESDIYYQSQSLLEQIKIDNEEKINHVIKELNSEFSQIIKRLVSSPISITQAFEKRDRIQSEGENIVTNLVFKVVVQSNMELTNGIGLLVSDNSISSVDNRASYSWHEIIEDICSKSGTQYIEFTTNNRNIKRENVIYEIERIHHDF